MKSLGVQVDKVASLLAERLVLTYRSNSIDHIPSLGEKASNFDLNTAIISRLPTLLAILLSADK